MSIKKYNVALISPSYAYNEDLLAHIKRFDQCNANFIDLRINTISPQSYDGTTQERSDALITALSSNEIDIIWIIRGGYGISHLIDSIKQNLATIKASKKKIIIGYSDVTLLGAIASQLLGFTWIHTSNFKEILSLSDEEFDILIDAIFNNSMPIIPATCINHSSRTLHSTNMVGGNLSMIQATIGCDFSFNFNGKTLFIEEFDEPAYRIERMMYHLLHAGVFENLEALVFGRLHGNNAKSEDIEAITKIPYHFANLLPALPIFISDTFGHDGKNLPIKVNSLS